MAKKSAFIFKSGEKGIGNICVIAKTKKDAILFLKGLKGMPSEPHWINEGVKKLKKCPIDITDYEV